MAKPIEPTPPLYGEDAEKLLESLKTMAPKEEIAKRQAESIARLKAMGLWGDREIRPYTTDTAGRKDVDGIVWFACDPYPTWYRYDNDKLVTTSEPKWS